MDTNSSQRRRLLEEETEEEEVSNGEGEGGAYVNDTMITTIDEEATTSGRNLDEHSYEYQCGMSASGPYPSTSSSTATTPDYTRPPPPPPTSSSPPPPNDDNDDHHPTTSSSTTPSSDAPIVVVTSSPKRRYQLHPGRNRFACGGRLVCSRSHGAFVVTVALMVATLTLYFVFDAPFLWTYSPAIPIVAAVISLSVISNFVATSFTDPGILPRVDNIEVIEMDRQMAGQYNPNNDPAMPRPRFRDVIINGEHVKMKYCTTCRLYRPPRCSHCAICDNCVLMFDHHCPWVGNCIGLRNYAYFYRFVFCLSVLIVYLFACAVTHISLLAQTMPFGDVMRKTPGSAIVVIVCFFTTWSIIGLSCFHTYLLCADLTTNEDLKGMYRKKPRNQPNSVTNVSANNSTATTNNATTESAGHAKNPFYTGCVKSFASRLFKSPFPSVLDASGYINDHPTIVIEVPKEKK